VAPIHSQTPSTRFLWLCDGPSASECTECNNQRNLVDGVCECIGATYSETDTDNCLSCATKCATWDGPTSSDCSSCYGSDILIDGSCVCDTDTFYFDESITCNDCHYSCETCYVGDGESCLTCYSGTHRELDGETGLC
jgi:hypothetical protein